MEENLSIIGISHSIFMIYKLNMVHEVPLRQKKLSLLHKVACRLNIHDDKWIFDPKWKEHGSKHKLSKI
jgi:hypothetical protein